MSVFISYSSKDSVFVGRLAAELIKRRIQVWVDKFEMQAGDSLLDKIQEGLDGADYLVVVLSRNSVESQWCRKELNAIMMSEIDDKTTRIIPILVDECTIPVFLREKLYADFREDFEHGVNELMRPLLHLVKDKMGRGTVNGVIVDYGHNWLLVKDRFRLNLDFAIWIESQKKSVILQVIIDGDENATARFKHQVSSGFPFLMKETLIWWLTESEDFRSLNIIASSGEVFEFEHGLTDPKAGITFNIKIRAVLLGIDNGNDIVLNFIDYIEILEETRNHRRQDILSQYR